MGPGEGTGGEGKARRKRISTSDSHDPGIYRPRLSFVTNADNLGLWGTGGYGREDWGIKNEGEGWKKNERREGNEGNVRDVQLV